MSLGGVAEFLKLSGRKCDHSPPWLRICGGIPPLLQVTSCVHSTLQPYPDILTQKLRKTRVMTARYSTLATAAPARRHIIYRRRFVQDLHSTVQ